MRAVTFQAPLEIRVDERPDPVLGGRDEAVVSIEACPSFSLMPWMSIPCALRVVA